MLDRRKETVDEDKSFGAILADLLIGKLDFYNIQFPSLNLLKDLLPRSI